MAQLNPANIIKRTIALFFDLGILLFVGWLIYVVLGERMYGVGKLKILIGILISTIYFTYFHSYLGNGQTLGKRLFKLKVLNVNGSFLTLKEAFIRSIIFTIPYCYSDILNIQFGTSINLWQLISFVIIPAMLFINHVYIFTNPNQRCYYDILLHTIVTDGNKLEESIQPRYNHPKAKYIPLVLLTITLILGVLIFNPFDSQNVSDLAELGEIENTLKANRNVHFSKFYYVYNERDDYSKTLELECYMPNQDQDISSEIYLLTEELNPLKEKFKIKKIKLNIVKDFNIGIFNYWEVLRVKGKQMKFDL